MTVAISLQSYRDLLAPGLLQARENYAGHWGAAAADLQIVELPEPGLMLRSYLPNTGQHIESFIPEATLTNGSPLACFKQAINVIFPRFIFADEAVVDYETPPY